MTGGRARTVFIGSGDFGRESLRRLAEHDDIDLLGVITAPSRPAGRHGRVRPTPISTLASALSVHALLIPTRLRDPDAIADVLALDPDLIVLADYGQIVPPALLEVRRGALNLHPSLLPRHRGATPIPAAILAGDLQTGVTLMRMDEGIDTGPIVAQAAVPLDGDETTPDLEAMLEVTAGDLLEEHVGPWLRGDAAARPQPDDGTTMTWPLRREDGRLDPARSAKELERQIRAYQPWPGTFVDAPPGRLILWSASPEVDRSAPPPGAFDETGLGVGRGERLRIGEVQPAGGRRMTWDAFVRGRPSIIGASIDGS